MCAYKKIGIVVADEMEFKPLYEYFTKNGAEETLEFSRKTLRFKVNSTDCVAVFCGIGKVNAAAITAKLISDGCDCIMNYGLSGGIGNSTIGKFAIPDSFMEHDFDLTPLGYKLCEKPCQEYIYYTDDKIIEDIKKVLPQAVVGAAVCGDRFISKKEDADFFQNNYNAKTCDMETAAIASVCDMAKIPLYCIRRVSDGADENVEQYRDMNINSGDVLFDNFYRLLDSIS
ncbi:MAG: 5'-methylthioadenosine/S-adenosylhomocysteine nucleosidase [Clostridia bacterium]|nr:5'-methylthioadenosine/S-adenosylhomocysteine nucleosidase [Clostridia bacterium]